MKIFNIFTIIFIAVVFISCKKDNADQPVNFMTATVNGVETDFSLAIYADTISPSGFVSTFISATQVGTNNRFAFNFISYNESPLVTGTFTGLNDYNLYGLYKNIPLNKDYTNPLFSGFTIAIENINNDYVEGSFHGVLKDIVHQPDSVIVTNGRFKAEFLH